MAIKKYKPTTPGRRGMTVTDYSVLSRLLPSAACWSPTRSMPAATTPAYRSPSRRRQPPKYRVIISSATSSAFRGPLI